MADLVTHMCTALLPGAILGGRWVGPVLLGTVLPDLASRVPGLALEQLHQRGIVEVPDAAMFAWGVLHVPSGLVLLCLISAYAFVEEHRRFVLGGLLVGCVLHLGLDVLQDHHGQGYMLLAPVSLERYELGWIGSEATVTWALPLAAITAVAWGIRLLWERRRSAA